MNTQISFTTDDKLKQRAMKKAKEIGLPLKSVLVFAMEAFVEGKIKLGIISPSKDDIEELNFDSDSVNKNAEKLANLLK